LLGLLQNPQEGEGSGGIVPSKKESFSLGALTEGKREGTGISKSATDKETEGNAWSLISLFCFTDEKKAN